MRPRVLLDVDGVLAQFTRAFLGAVRAELGHDYDVDAVTTYSLIDCLGLSKAEFDRCAAHVNEPGFARTLDVYPGAVEGVAALHRVADVYIVTSPWNSNPTWTYDREAWLAEHFGIPHSRVVHTSAKHLVRGDVLVDDKTSTLVEWQAEHPTGIAVQWVTPHNARDQWDGAATRDWPTLCQMIGALS